MAKLRDLKASLLDSELRILEPLEIEWGLVDSEDLHLDGSVELRGLNKEVLFVHDQDIGLDELGNAIENRLDRVVLHAHCLHDPVVHQRINLRRIHTNLLQ